VASTRGKTINGRKRHIVVDTIGLIVGLLVHAADIQDRDGAPAALKTILERWRWAATRLRRRRLCRAEARCSSASQPRFDDVPSWTGMSRTRLSAPAYSAWIMPVETSGPESTSSNRPG
jgi:hypothetical protein